MSDLDNLVIDIKSNDDDTQSVLNLNMDSNNDRPSVNFGGGIELLMNDKKKSNVASEIGLGELSELENELNDLTADIGKKSLENSRSNLFDKAINNVSTGINKPQTGESKGIKIEKETINLGQATSGGYTDNKSWDGYGKFNNIPNISQEAPMAKEELVREKFKFLRRLEDLERKGATLTKKYNMDSPLSELQGEYEMIISEKEKSNSVKFQGKMLMAAITGIEFLNNKFDPFDLKMDGWGEQLNENIGDYDEIFMELHEKYKSKAKLAPELKLLFQLGGSAIMVHMTNTMFKSSMPGMDDIMKQNPELMQQFTQAAVNSMGESKPGFGNFMGSFMPGSNNTGPPPSQNMGSPPPAVNTQAQKSQRYAPPQNRPDLTASRSQEGVNIQDNYSSIESSIQEINTPQSQNTRPEMRGPSDISQLLSGLKTKPVNMQQSNIANEKNPSTISVSDLKELSRQKMPKSNKKAKSGSSARNTISLDL